MCASQVINIVITVDVVVVCNNLDVTEKAIKRGKIKCVMRVE